MLYFKADSGALEDVMLREFKWEKVNKTVTTIHPTVVCESGIGMKTPNPDFLAETTEPRIKPFFKVPYP